jgi:hypothetical protein
VKRGAQLTETGQFLRALFPLVDNWSLVELRIVWKDRCPKSICVRKVCSEFFADLDLLEETAMTLAPGGDVYIGVATRRSAKSGKKDNLAWTSAYFAEVDAGPGKPYGSVDDILKTLEGFKPVPTMKIMSGGGLHLYWVVEWPMPLATPAQIKEYESVNKGLGQRLKADPSTWNADRILRLPGTLWHKQEPAREVKLLE